jgi:Zn-dependent protease with chaperone function
MKLNTANRSFFVLVGMALVPYGLLGLLGCGVLSLVGYRLAAHGLSGLDRGGQDLRPAVAFFAVVAIGTIVAAASIRRQVRATRRLQQVIAGRALPPTPSLAGATARARLHGQVDLVDDTEPFSFTYGLFAPRIAVSRGLLEATDLAELDAVLAHERYHLRNRDTLKVVVARAAPAAFFFLPALGYLRDRYLACRELAADRHAVNVCGERALTGALVKALAGPSWVDLGAAAALGGPAFLEHRVEQLENGREPSLPSVPRAAFWATAAGLGVLVGAFALTLAVSGSADISVHGSMGTSVAGTMAATLGGAVCMTGMVVLGIVLMWRAVN